jgi:putative transcriptional regulator
MAPRYESRLRKYREDAGFSQERLARELGVSRQTIANIERGVSQPRVMLALAIAAILGVALSELFRKGSK